ncbi:MotA/TolQ/ExbB proton channel family protein [Marinoscillum sp. MHG1-6]|uniref:MotA/TolQ/ExbB proton channel family protein n=1 Tax=Marinoscillum sp. MHG1-6 TaxID=2959627 RepID=UPI00215718CE|nr:MotA/TolQ/ExbB proton channel family protein [Marinoscillum sp. MHG1-6]
MNLPLYTVIIYGLLFGWAVFSMYYMVRLYYLGLNKVISHVYDTIPTVFTTLGVLGTFLGIYYGLQDFDENNITESIPGLLQGMKTAFSTSIWGIALSLVFGKASQYMIRVAERKEPPKATGELAALNEIIKGINLLKSDNDYHFQTLNKSLIGEVDSSLATQLVKLRNTYSETNTQVGKQTEALVKVQKALGGDEETSLLTQMQKLRAEEADYALESKKQFEQIGSASAKFSEQLTHVNESIHAMSSKLGSEESASIQEQLEQLKTVQVASTEQAQSGINQVIESMEGNNEMLSSKFDEFSELLAKNNTEALVEVMKQVTEEFNSQMSALIEKLVQENFQELNNSVERLNTWQQENKVMIAELTKQFTQVSNDFQITSVAIQDITVNTGKLTDDNSHLTKLIEALQKVMIEDTKYQEITKQLTSSVETVKGNIEAFDETTEKLNAWVRNQMNFTDSVAKLLTRLEEIDRIKDINEVFWEDTKKQLNEGVSLIEKASSRLADDVESINEEFYERLNDTLQNLDTLIQRVITNYAQ